MRPRNPTLIVQRSPVTRQQLIPFKYAEDEELFEPMYDTSAQARNVLSNAHIITSYNKSWCDQDALVRLELSGEVLMDKDAVDKLCDQLASSDIINLHVVFGTEVPVRDTVSINKIRANLQRIYDTIANNSSILFLHIENTQGGHVTPAHVFQGALYDIASPSVVELHTDVYIWYAVSKFPLEKRFPNLRKLCTYHVVPCLEVVLAQPRLIELRIRANADVFTGWRNTAVFVDTPRTNSNVRVLEIHEIGIYTNSNPIPNTLLDNVSVAFPKLQHLIYNTYNPQRYQRTFGTMDLQSIKRMPNLTRLDVHEICDVLAAELPPDLLVHVNRRDSALLMLVGEYYTHARIMYSNHPFDLQTMKRIDWKAFREFVVARVNWARFGVVAAFERANASCPAHKPLVGSIQHLLQGVSDLLYGEQPDPLNQLNIKGHVVNSEKLSVTRYNNVIPIPSLLSIQPDHTLTSKYYKRVTVGTSRFSNSNRTLVKRCRRSM